MDRTDTESNIRRVRGNPGERGSVAGERDIVVQQWQGARAELWGCTQESDRGALCLVLKARGEGRECACRRIRSMTTERFLSRTVSRLSFMLKAVGSHCRPLSKGVTCSDLNV